MSMNGIEIRRAGLEEIIDVRWVVLRDGLPRESAFFAGDDAAGTIHVGAFDGGRCIGCGTYMRSQWQEAPAWQLRGMGVLDGYRSRGVGQLILTELERLAAGEWPVGMRWCNAREGAVTFYKRQGWEVVSERFVIADAGPHFRMVRRVG